MKRLEQENLALTEKVQKLEEEFTKVYKTATELEQERDFYFGKALANS